MKKIPLLKIVKISILSISLAITLQIHSADFKPAAISEHTQALIEKTQLGSLEERSAAIEEAGITGCKTCYYSLISLLKDESPIIRRKTAISIGLLRNKNAISHLEKALEVEKEESVKVDFIRALGFLASPEAAKLASSYLSNESEKIRFAAAKTLTVIADIGTYDKITAQLKSESSDSTKVLLLHAALKMKLNAEHILELVKYFYSSTRLVRLYAARAAADLKIKETLLDLKKAVIMEPDVELREQFFHAYNVTFNK